MTELKRKYLMLNLAISLVVLLLSVLVLVVSNIYGENWNVYSLVPIVFFYMALFQLSFLWFCRMVSKKPGRMPLSFSLVKGVRFIAVILFAIYYGYKMSERGEVKIFLVLFAVYFIVWLFFDTFFFFRNNKHLVQGGKL